MFYAHGERRGVAELWRIWGVHDGSLFNVALCASRLATASEARATAMRDVGTRKRLTVLRGHAGLVRSIDMND
jgi:hypothetical protein